MLVTFTVFNSSKHWLYNSQPSSIPSIFVTESASKLSIFTLNNLHPFNIFFIVVTLDVLVNPFKFWLYI